VQYLIKKLIVVNLAIGFLLTACSSHNVSKELIKESSKPNTTILETNNKTPETRIEITPTPQQKEIVTLTNKIEPINTQEYCKKHVTVMNEYSVWTEDDGKTGYNFWTDHSKHLNDLIDCGWNINLPNKRGVYPLIQALEVFNNSPDQLRSFLTYNPSLGVKDNKGHDMYIVALAVGILPNDVVRQIMNTISIEEQQKDEKIIQMTLHGSILSTDELENIIRSGIDINEDLTDYAFLYDEKININPQDPDWETGTILGSAVKHSDIAKVKWLLDHGADANRHFGNNEFNVSPLRYALTSNIGIAELLLQHHANPNEKIMLNPGAATLYAANACNAKISELLNKYGGTTWYYQGEGEKGMELFTKEQVLSTCKKVNIQEATNLSASNPSK
jgi:ankyrin repeat protein